MSDFHLADERHTVIMGAFSSITSPVFSELVVVLAGEALVNLPQAAVLFETLRRMKEVRHFQLVFSFEGPCLMLKEGRWGLVEPQQELKRALDSVAAKGFLDFLDSPPTLRSARSHPSFTGLD